ncbi:MAG: hypothetical protein QXX68_02010 [Candidatus Pacearchaeota archaeon]
MTFSRFDNEEEFRSFRASDLERLFEEDRVELRLAGGRKLFSSEQEKELEKLEGVWALSKENDNGKKIVFLKKPHIILFAREDEPSIVSRYSGFEKDSRGYFRFDILNDFLNEGEIMEAQSLFFEPRTKMDREFITLHLRIEEEDMAFEFNKENINVENLRYYFYPNLSRNMLNKDFVIVGMNYPLLNKKLRGDFGTISLAEGGKFVVPKKSDHPLEDGKPFTIEEVRSFRGLPFLFVNGRKKVEVNHPAKGTLEISVSMNGVLTADKDGSPIFSMCFTDFNEENNLTRNLSEKENNEVVLEKLRIAAGASFLDGYYILSEK